MHWRGLLLEEENQRKSGLNDTNFVRVQLKLHRTKQKWSISQIHEYLLKEITWKFKPPGASHIDGVWERQIRTIKVVLAGVVKQQTLGNETLVTYDNSRGYNEW